VKWVLNSHKQQDTILALVLVRRRGKDQITSPLIQIKWKIRDLIMEEDRNFFNSNMVKVC